MTESSNPQETLPGNVPHFIVFFLPNLWGFVLAYLLELVGLEERISQLLPASTHPFSLFGVSFFALFNVGSYLTGCVVCARLKYNIKLPNLYATKAETKHAVLFNCVQRGHQNFLENLPVVITSALFTALIAERPNVAAVVLFVVSVARILYAWGYQHNVADRFPYFLLAQFAGNVGIGYGMVVGLSLLGMGPFVVSQ